MPTAVPELIALELVTRLEAITTGNGYSFSVPAVSRMNRRANDQKYRNLELIVEQGEDVPNEELSHEGNPPAMAYDVTYHIHGFVRQSDTSTTPDATTENALLASIKKAVAGTSTWYTFDSNAIIADWQTAVPFVSPEGDHQGVTVPLVVTYRVSETDPYEVRS